MNIKLTEYIGASTIALNIKDVPMTALPGIKDAFVRLCETVEAVREPIKADQWPVSASEIGTKVAPLEINRLAPLTSLIAGEVMQPVEMTVREVPELVNVDTSRQEAEAQDKPRRGRPKKVETATEDKEPTGEPAAVLPTNTAESVPETITTPGTSELPDITDSELQKYCAKLAAHFGDPKKVFDLAQPFVPEGAVARPTNIKDNAQRHAFIQAAEAASGVKYHG